MKLNEQNGPATLSHCWTVTLFVGFAFIGSESVIASDLLLRDQRAQGYLHVRFSPDGRFVAAASILPRKEGRAIAIWEVATGDLLQWIDNTKRDIPGGIGTFDFCPPNYLVAVSPNGSHLFFIQHELVNRKDAWKMVASIPKRVHPRSRLVFMDWIACSPDGKHLVCNSASMKRGGFNSFGIGAVEVWDLSQKRMVSTIETPSLFPHEYNFLDEEGLMYLCSARIVHAKLDGDIVATRGNNFLKRNSELNTMDVSPDQQHVVVGGDRFIAILDAQTLETTKLIELPVTESPEILRYTPNGRWLVEFSATARLIRIRNAESGEVVGERGLSVIRRFDISPDSQTIAVTDSGDMKGVHLWKLKDLIDEAE